MFESGVLIQKVVRCGWLCCGRSKAIHGTLILGVLPRNTTAKPATPHHLPNDITFLADVENQQQQQQKKLVQPFEFMLFSLDVAFSLSFDFGTTRERMNAVEIMGYVGASEWGV